MRARAGLVWRAATAVAFGATAALAVILSRGAPVSAALASAGTSGAHAVSPRLAARTARCTVAGLHISLGPGARLTAVITRYQLEFTNTSGVSCTLAGYPQVAAYRGDDVQVGLAASHDTSAAARRVLLAPGQDAFAVLELSLTARCRPVRASGLRVVVPGEAAARYVSQPLTTCVARTAAGQDYLLVRAIQPGTGAGGGLGTVAGGRPAPRHAPQSPAAA